MHSMFIAQPEIVWTCSNSGLRASISVAISRSILYLFVRNMWSPTANSLQVTPTTNSLRESIGNSSRAALAMDAPLLEQEAV